MDITQESLPENTPDAVRNVAKDIDQRIADFKAGRQRPAPQVTDGQQATDGQQQPVAAAPAPNAPAATTEASIAQLEAKRAELETKVTDLQHQFDTGVGRYGGTISQLKAKIAELEQVNTALAARPPAPATPTPPPASGTPWLDGVSDDDLDRNGEPYYKQQWDLVQRILNQRKPATDTATEELNKLKQELKGERFMDRVEAIVPGSNEINGDPVTGLGCDPDWPAFLDLPLYDGGITTRRQEATAAFASNNAPAFAAIVKAFKDSKSTRTDKNENKTAVPKDLRAEIVPPSVRGRVPPKLADERVIIPQSEILAFKERAMNPQTSKLTVAEVEAKMQEYAQAYAGRRVDMNR